KEGTIVSDLLDAGGRTTTISLEINDDFAGQNELGFKATNTPLLMPEEVSKDLFWANAATFSNKINSTAGFEISGLDPNIKYNFSFFSARSAIADNLETQYTIIGTTQYSTTLDASKNTTKLAVITDVVPNPAGKVTISLTAGENNNHACKFYFINSMQILPQQTN